MLRLRANRSFRHRLDLFEPRVHRAEKSLVEDCGPCRLCHRGIGRASALSRVRSGNDTLRIAQSVLRDLQTAAQGISYIEHAAMVGMPDGRSASAMLRMYERQANRVGAAAYACATLLALGATHSQLRGVYQYRMTTFSYAFGVAISIAMALAIGNAWVREHRNGVWTLPMAAGVVIAGVAVGIAVGWSLQQYLAFVAASATGRI
jgi:hypothetical protein